MMFFKPDILARSRSLDDDIADSAMGEWEKATAAYREYLGRWMHLAPREVQLLDEKYTLHDAAVVSAGFDPGSETVALALRLDDGRGDLLLLDYRGVASLDRLGPLPELTTSLEPATPRVLYHEFGIEEQERKSKSHRFVHALLLTGGFEIKVAFTGLTLRHMRPVIADVPAHPAA